MRKLVKTFVRAGTWREIIVGENKYKPSNIKYAIRVDKNGDIRVFVRDTKISTDWVCIDSCRYIDVQKTTKEEVQS